jgi:hypothetical protein
VKFHHVIESEQKKHPDKCIYHLSKSHPTAECSVKKECDKILANRKDSNGPTLLTGSSGHLRHVKEEVFEDAVSEDLVLRMFLMLW